MKMLPTMLFAVSLLCVPAHAHCPLMKDNAKPKPAKKPIVVTHRAVPEPEPFWHDLHWFE